MNSRVSQIVSALKACSRSKNLFQGKKMHQAAIEYGFGTNAHVASILVTMYSSCRDMRLARKAFDQVQDPDVVLWTALILGYAENHQGEEALSLFSNMRAKGCEPDGRTYVAALKACSAAREDGEQLNGRLVRVKSLENIMLIQSLADGFRDIFIAGALVDVYGRCGSMHDARRTFDTMPSYDIVSWNALLLGYVENGEERLALDMFWSSEEALERSNHRTFTVVLKACTSLATSENVKKFDGGLMVKTEALRQGMMVHAQAVKQGCDSESFVANGLIDLYSSCGSLFDARRVFDRMPEQDVVCWNSLMTGYVENAEEELSLELFRALNKERMLQPDAATFIAASRACIGLAAGDQILEQCSEVEATARETGHEKNIRVASSLLHMYSKLGSMADARRIFANMDSHDVVSWTAMILGYADNNQEDAALEIYASMQTRGCEANARTFVAVLKAFTGLSAKENARLIDGKLVKLESLERSMAFHARIKVEGYDVHETYVGNTLMDLYVKCGSLIDARRVFDGMEKHDEVSWNVLILACAESDEAEAGVGLFEQVETTGGFSPGPGAFVAALKAYGVLATKEDGGRKQRALERCLWLYSRVLESEAMTKSDMLVASTLIETFAKCGSMENARQVFETVKVKDVVLWTSIMSGYVESHNEDEALELYREMRASNVSLDSACYVAVLKACGNSACLEAGRAVRADVCRYVNTTPGCTSELEMNACLIDMYGKCGDAVAAQQVFDSCGRTDSVTWTALISGYSRHGDAVHALRWFEQMVWEGVRADRVTFVCVLAACSHAGEVEKGKKVLKLMLSEFGITPGPEHHACMSDVLERANHLICC